MIEKIKKDGKEIILIGTAHVSKQSIELVNKTIEEEKPDLVCVELCRQRYESLENEKKWEETEVLKLIKEGKSQLFLLNLLLSNFQKRIGERIGVKPGAEMIEALNSAKKNNIPFKLVDRDIRITFKRAMNTISLREKFKLFFNIFAGLFEVNEIDEKSIEKLKEKDIISEVMEELGSEFPDMKRVLIDERDLYIANKIINSEGKKIVAVVGAGHVNGIKNIILNNRTKEKASINEIKKLEEIPKEKNLLKYTLYGVTFLFIGILVYGFYAKGLDAFIYILSVWFILHAVLSAIGVIIAMGHPLTVLTAFIAAPFTALHPGIAVGMIAGLVEAKMRPPKVKDFNELQKIKKISDLWHNRISKVFLVMFFSNLGGSIGTFLAPLIAAQHIF